MHRAAGCVDLEPDIKPRDEHDNHQADGDDGGRPRQIILRMQR